MSYTALNSRYESMPYNSCGKSGLVLPKISFGLWHNFGRNDDIKVAREMVFTCFDSGINHFDLANVYGPPEGSAEITFAKILKDDISQYRDEIVISTKAGHEMWDGPFGSMNSRKHLVSSLDRSLERLGLDYVDIFYSHRPDFETPIEETVLALDSIVKQGKALYVGVSKYPEAMLKKAIELFRELKTPFVIDQDRYSMLRRDIETNGVLETLGNNGIGCITFSPLQQGLLTSKYLRGIPANSRAAKTDGFLQKSEITPELVVKLNKLNVVATERGQTLAQMAITWIFRDPRITSVIVGASRVEQIEDNLSAVNATALSEDEIKKIESILE